jgi:hemerythrin superfamily protein
LSGVVGSAVTRSDDEMTIREIIRMDHAKVNTLFTEIGASNDPQKIQEYFGQLYKDLSAHAQAEEQVVYPAVRSSTKGLKSCMMNRLEMKQLLEQIKALNPSSPMSSKIKLSS